MPWRESSAWPVERCCPIAELCREFGISRQTGYCWLKRVMNGGENDRQNISQGLPELYLAMKKVGTSAELYVYAGVCHGFGYRPTRTGAVTTWPQRFLEWLGTKGFLKADWVAQSSMIPRLRAVTAACVRSRTLSRLSRMLMCHFTVPSVIPKVSPI